MPGVVVLINKGAIVSVVLAETIPQSVMGLGRHRSPGEGIEGISETSLEGG